MVSTFNEFQLTFSQYPLDIIPMCETWLNDNTALLDYVTIAGYTAIFRNREQIKGGGVGASIKENIKFKHRKDIESLQPEFEHLWMEIPGRNKYNKVLTGVMYKSTRILSNSDWLERLEALLGHLTVTWDALLFLTGDMNIDMLHSCNNHDGVLPCVNVRVTMFQPRYKYIRNEKYLDESAFRDDFSTFDTRLSGELR